jgi:predicted transposase YbfD/YdcC
LLVRVKDNQPRLRDALLALCEAQAPVDRFDSVDCHAHGREEHRRVEVFAVDDRLDPGWRPFIACVVRVTRRSPCRDTRTGLWPQRREIACYACQIPLDAKTCATAIRGHWSIENRNHHVRDRTLGEDASRVRRKPGILARLRSFALNILRAHGVGNVREALYVNALSLDRLLAYGLPTSQN